MGKVYEKISDFNNVSVELRLNRKIFNAIINVYNDDVYVDIDITKDYNLWENFDKNLNEINGRTIFNDVPISFINCYFSEKYTNKSNKNTTILYLVFRVGFILIGEKMTKINSNIFDGAEVRFDNIDNLTNTYPYSFDPLNKKYQSNSTTYKICCDLYNIDFCFSFDNKSKKFLRLERNTFVCFSFKKSVSFEKLLGEIYKINYLLMILMRKHIVVENIIFLKKDSKCKVFVCSSDKPYEYKLNNSELLNIVRPKIEDIKDNVTIFNCFLKEFDKLYPVLDIYYNTVCSYTSDLNRFIVGTTTLEYFSNEFDCSGAVLHSKNNPNHKKGKIDYADKVYSLIKRVNCVYNFSELEIENITKNIVDARVYYIHYKKNRKQLSIYEQFYYSHFVFDILILNIGILIGIDQSILKSLSNYGKFYEKVNLL